MKANQKQIVLTVSTVLIAVLVVALSTSLYTRIDVTENAVYTISQSSVELSRSLAAPAEITYYRSDILAEQFPEITLIQDILLEYAGSSNGRVNARVLPAEESEFQQLQAIGLSPRNFQVFDGSQSTTATVFSGLIISYLDDQEIIPFVEDPSLVEYQLTKSLTSLTRESQIQVGALLGDSSMSLDQDYSILDSVVQQIGVLRPINPGEIIPGDIDVLVVIGAKDLAEVDWFSIDQFIASGKGTIIAADPVGLNIQTFQTTEPLPADNGLFSLIENLGMSLKPAWLVEPRFVKNIRYGQPSQFGTVTRIEPYSLWPTVPSGTVEANSPILANFEGFDFYWASPLEIIDGENIQSLLSSSEESWLMEDEFYFDPSQPFLFTAGRDRIQEYGPPYTMAALRTGPYQSSYDASIEGRELLYPESSDIQVLVVPDADAFSNLMEVTGARGNVSFLRNALEYFGSGEQLLSIRNRSIREAALDQIADPAERKNVYDVATAVNVALVPLAFIVFGIARFHVRRNRRKTAINEQTGGRDQ